MRGVRPHGNRSSEVRKPPGLGSGLGKPPAGLPKPEPPPLRCSDRANIKKKSTKVKKSPKSHVGVLSPPYLLFPGSPEPAD